MGLFTKVFGTYSQRELKSIYPIVDKITALEDAYKALTDAQLQAKTPEFKSRLQNGETLDDILPEAFAAVREAADRVLGMRPYPVQLVGGIVLHQGRIAEMKTGEGKTLVATLPAYIREVDDENLHAMALVENIQRQDLNAIEIALGMQRLIDECNLTQDALSEKVGKKRSSVSNYLRLLKLPDEVQLALKEGLISMGHAKAIAGAPADQQLRVLKRCIKKGLSVRQVEELVRSLSEAPGKEAQNVEDEEYPESYLKLVEQLEKFFSQEISIKRAKNGGGKIVIGFTDDSDIEQFIERFAKRS